MKTTIVNECLHCGLQLPDTAHFCPECGRPVEVINHIDNGIKEKRAAITQGCWYCGLQLAEDVHFCPECGRLIERDSFTHANLELEAGSPKTEIERKGDLVGQR